MITIVYSINGGFPLTHNLFLTVHCPLVLAKEWCFKNNAVLLIVKVDGHTYDMRKQ